MINKTIYKLYLVILLFSASLMFAEDKTLDAGSIQLQFDETDGDTVLSDKLKDDYFTAGTTIIFSGSADDTYLMGKTVNYYGESSGGMIAIGETVDLGGIVTGNVHSAAETLNITGNLGDTAFIAGDKIIIGKDAIIDGTVISASKTLHIMGELNDGLLAGGGEIIIDSTVKGDVNVRTGKLIITERGFIDGNLIYGSNTKLSEAEKGRVSGDVVYKESDNIEKEDFTGFFILIKGFILLSLVISGLLILLFPGIKNMFKRDMNNENYGRTLLWGLIPLFIFPVLVIVTIPLVPLSISLGLSSIPLFGMAMVFGLALFGQLIFKLFKWESKNILIQFLFASAVYTVLLLVPFLNVLVIITIAAMGAGLIIGKLFRTNF